METNDDIPDWASNELLLQISRLDSGNKMLSNGRYYEIFNVMADKWYRLRVSTVDPLGVSHELKFTQGCDVHKVASDGVWHSVVPFPDEPPRNRFMMTGSSRGDFAIRCSSATTTDYINVLFGDKLTGIINVKLGNTTSNLWNELGSWIPKRPPSIQSMISASVPEKNQLKIEVTRDSINGQKWDPSVPISTLAYNEIIEWELPNTISHPFHTHL